MTAARYGSTMQINGSGTIGKAHPSSPAKSGRVYASVAEMKRKGKVRTCGAGSRARVNAGLGLLKFLGRETRNEISEYSEKMTTNLNRKSRSKIS